MNNYLIVTLCLVNIAIMPLLLMGVIRKVKALMQNRIGAPVFQSFYDIAKLIRKGETISRTASWIFRWAPGIGLSTALITALIAPWSGVTLLTGWTHASNFLLVLYLLGLSRFFLMLAALDTGSAFGGLGASREATISMLVEPTLIIGFGALSLSSGSMDLSTIYASHLSPLVAALVGGALVVASLAELSRMPVDDPTTHLELTMVHEAMILENSGRNLALIELTVALRTCIFLGLAAQTLLRVYPSILVFPQMLQYGAGLLALFSLCSLIAVAEGILVKLNWRRVSNFLAFATVLSILAALVAVARG